jgi:hypothetical protein
MKPFLLVLILAFLCLNVSAQYGFHSKTPVDTNELYYFKQRIYKNGVRLGRKEVGRIYAENWPSLELYRSSRAVKTISYIFSCSGGFAVGWYVGSSLAGERLGSGLLWAGGGAMVVGIVLESVANGQVRKSVELYNGKRGKTTKLEYGLMGDGLGVCMRF